MTAPYRFLGDSASLTVNDDQRSLTRFGESVELNEDQIERAFSTNLPVIPEEAFHSVGFTNDELSKYPTAFAQASAPASFLEKKRAALQILHDLRAQHNEVKANG